MKEELKWFGIGIRTSKTIKDLLDGEVQKRNDDAGYIVWTRSKLINKVLEEYFKAKKEVA